MQKEKFEELTKWDYSDIQGDTDQVILNASTTGGTEALLIHDLMPDGTYPVYYDEDCVVTATSDKGKTTFNVHIKNATLKGFRREMEQERQRIKHLKLQQHAIYHVLPCHLIALELLHNVRQSQNDKIEQNKFEKKLAEVFPECWIDISKAPKKLIGI